GEGVVHLVRPSHPEDIVEAQRVLVRRCEPPQLEIGPVQQDPSQRPDLRVDEEPRRRPGRASGTIDVLLEEAHWALLLPPPSPTPSTISARPSVAAAPSQRRPRAPWFRLPPR